MKHNRLLKLKYGIVLFLLTIIVASGCVYAQPTEDEEDDIEDVAFVPSTVEKPIVSHTSGFYNEQFALKLSTTLEGATIYYTLDASIPDDDNEKMLEYTTELTIYERKDTPPSATVLRAAIKDKDGNWSDPITHTYFVFKNADTHYKIPIVSMVTEHENMYDRQIGLLRNRDKSGKEWERPAYMEYFDEEGDSQVAINVGIRLHGGASRNTAFPSLRIYARKEYDTQSKIKYDFFSDSLIPSLEKNGKQEPITSFKRLILRNTGNEAEAWESVFFRDVMIQAMTLKSSNLDLQAYKPAVTFLNGEYYGITNLRERFDDKYLESHYNVDETNFAVYSFWYEGATMKISMADGDSEDKEYYQEFYDYIEEHDLEEEEHYQYVEERLDIDNFIDYYCIQIYCGNNDWPGNNLKMWRYKGEPIENAPYGLDGKLRFLVFDTDFGFGLYNDPVEEDDVAAALAPNRNDWPNPKGSTLIFRRLVENQEFREKFVNRFMDLINTDYQKDEVYKLVDGLAEIYEPIIAEHREKFPDAHELSHNIDIIKDYASKRAKYVQVAILGNLRAGVMLRLGLDFGNDVKAQSIIVNDSVIVTEEMLNKNGMWDAIYASKVPITLEAVAPAGYEFVKWEADGFESFDKTCTIVDKAGEFFVWPMFQKTDATIAPSTEEATTIIATEPNTDDKTANDFIPIICVVLILVLGFGIIILSRKK